MSRNNTAVFVGARIVPVSVNADDKSGVSVNAEFILTRIDACIIEVVAPFKLLYLKNIQGVFILNSLGSKITVGL